MKPLTCEMCGSTDLVKSDGVFVCQSCGTKYSVEEAKKMMIEGPVTVEGSVKVVGTVMIDKDQQVKNLIKLGEESFLHGKFEEAFNYANRALELDSKSFDAWNIKMGYYVFTSSDFDWKIEEIIEAGQKALEYHTGEEDIVELCQGYFYAMKGFLDISINLLQERLEIDRDNVMKDLFVAISNLDKAKKKVYSRDKNLQFVDNMVPMLFKLREEVPNDAIAKSQILIEHINDLSNKWVEFARQYHIRLKTYYETNGLSEDEITKFKEGLNIIRKGLPENENNSPDLNKALSETKVNNGCGCYVATAIYGSYDCPEVWTLRRFRDQKLAHLSLGRLFIKTYYAISPTLVNWFGNTKWFQKLFRSPLDKLVYYLNSKGYENTQYNDPKY